jgi:parvulin-like peptidyl-prolyl isomerase
MKAFSLLVFLSASLGWTQSAPPAAADKSDAVIAIFEDGSKMTQGEFQALIPVLPDTYRALAQQNPERFLKVYGMFKKAAASADSQKLGEKAPYKQGVEFAVMAAMAQADYLESTATIVVEPEEIEKYYNAHKEPFRRIKVSGIKVAFGGAAAPVEAGSTSVNASRIPKKVLTEDEAKAKADKLVAQIRAGADFSKLVQTESDDENSKAKGGDLGVWSMTDNVPDALREAVLSLKEGEASEPIRQPGGFYIVHADAVTYAPLADVRDAIFSQLKQEKSRAWLDALDKSTKVDFPKNEPVPPPSDPKK